jgi:uncharacterized FlaG/YvyC family protein
MILTAESLFPINTAFRDSALAKPSGNPATAKASSPSSKANHSPDLITKAEGEQSLRDRVELSNPVPQKESTENGSPRSITKETETETLSPIALQVASRQEEHESEKLEELKKTEEEMQLNFRFSEDETGKQILEVVVQGEVIAQLPPEKIRNLIDDFKNHANDREKTPSGAFSGTLLDKDA